MKPIPIYHVLQVPTYLVSIHLPDHILYHCSPPSLFCSLSGLPSCSRHVRLLPTSGHSLHLFLPQTSIHLTYYLSFHINVTSSDSSLQHSRSIYPTFCFWHLSPHYTITVYLLLSISLFHQYTHQDNRGLVPSCTDST